MLSLSAEEVAKHNTEDDAWVTFRSKVLDVTKFMHTHPGGKQYFSPLLGQDITQQYEENNHSDVALMMTSDLIIGTCEDDGTAKATPVVKARLIDHTKGTLWQIWSKLSLEQYVDFINSPFHVDTSVRIFDSAFLEPFSKTPWYVIPIFWLPISFYYLVTSGLTLPQMLLWFVAGVFWWTFFEYIMHRFIFHAEQYMLNFKPLLCLHYLFHGIHHAYPMDKLRLVFPPALSCILAGLVKPLYNAVLPMPLCSALWAGKLVGYVIYDCFHYFAHHHAFTFGYLRFMKSYHMYHHYKTPDAGYGVSNKLWDVVFNTEIPLKEGLINAILS
mmetsp:Transcript_12377/g.23449  ORF Transcript_12377/g.23449 Transcript_12377/m.23449 type:complete len:328 (-) Transcript_12377:2512-3495(-)